MSYPSLKLHKLYLQAFWQEFGNQPYGRRGVSIKSKQKTIKAMQELGEVKLYFSPQAHSYGYRRKEFERKKKNLSSFTGFKHCFACRGEAQVRHHLIWITNGGRNNRKNIVALCRDCHAEIHPWLKNLH